MRRTEVESINIIMTNERCAVVQLVITPVQSGCIKDRTSFEKKTFPEFYFYEEYATSNVLLNLLQIFRILIGNDFLIDLG